MFWGMVQIFRGLSHPFGRMILPSGYLLHSHGKSAFLIGKPSINGPFRMGMLNNHSVMIFMCQCSPGYQALKGFDPYRTCVRCFEIPGFAASVSDFFKAPLKQIPGPLNIYPLVICYIAMENGHL